MQRRFFGLKAMLALLALMMGGASSCDHGPPPDLPTNEKACAGKGCGEICNLCGAGNEGCSDTVLTRGCNSEGECVPTPVQCTPAAKSTW